MKRSDVYRNRKKWMIRHVSYRFTYFDNYDYSILKNIMYLSRSGQGHEETFNDCIMMLDTETSKETPGEVCKNYIVAWTLSIRAFDMNIVTFWGQKPSEVVECINRIMMQLSGNKSVIYIHNASYDWVFLRKFFMRAWGTPVHQLNIKSHYPLFIEFSNGLIFKDSLILAQRKLEKWADDLEVEHRKASGLWDYDLKRNQNTYLNHSEKQYIEHDTLAGVECIQKTMDILNKRIYSIPYTATGIPREQVQKLAKKHKGHDNFLKMCPDYGTQCVLEQVFHGGYTHNNRHYVEKVIKGKDEDGNPVKIEAFDFASCYPYCMLAYKFPMEAFREYKNCSPEYILNNAEDYAFIFKLIMIKPKLKDDFIPMPALQKSKCTKTINAIDDNGRILCAEYAEIYLNEQDLFVIMQQYECDRNRMICVEVKYAHKSFLPRWFTDYIYQCFVDKTMLKGGDAVSYSIAKAKLNSLYGMCVQKPVKLLIEEDYESGDYSLSDEQDPEELYEIYKNRHNSVLPYQWGVWVTSYAFKRLFELGSYAGTWLYSDTDSCYGTDWDKEKIEAFNENCKKILTDRGYGAVYHNNREYWLGIAELDGTYSEFISVGAKRYACRDYEDGHLKITVAGVPKRGVCCLNDDLHNFHAGFIFDGILTGKKLHTYFMEEDIWIDEEGNERGDSIDLSPASYLLDSVRHVNWEKIYEEEIKTIIYEEGD